MVEREKICEILKGLTPSGRAVKNRCWCPNHHDVETNGHTGTCQQTRELCLELENARPETGVMQFGDDWPGIFCRGDDCMNYYIHLQGILNILKTRFSGKLTHVEQISIKVLEGLLRLLRSCHVGEATTEDAKNWQRAKLV